MKLKGILAGILSSALIAVPLNVSATNVCTFNDYSAMPDSEFAREFNLTEYNFSNDNVDDSIKFENYLNQIPDYFIGESYESETYKAYKMFISGKAVPYISFNVNADFALDSEVSAKALGLPENWDIECIEGEWIIELSDKNRITYPIHEYRVFIPETIISDFESYVKLCIWVKYSADEFLKDNIYGIEYCNDINHQFACYNSGTQILYNDIKLGDSNCDGDVNIADAVLVQQFIVNPDKYTLSEQGRINADVCNTGDGVTMADALEIQLMIANS